MLVGGKKLRIELEKIAKKSEDLEVGFFPQSTYDDGKPVAQVAYWQEYGTENIPVRAFFRTTIQDNKLEYAIKLGKFIKNNNYNYDLSFMQLGNEVKYNLMESIDDWDTPPNAESTIKRKGFNNPLIDTGKMRDSVRWRYKDNESA